MFDRACLPRRLASPALALALITTLASAASAHPGHIEGLTGGDFADGIAHPFSGLDHILTMVAVGLWASQLGRPAFWVLPLAFPAVMAMGAAAGLSAAPLPWIEIALTGTVVALGAVIALGLRPSLVASAGLIAAFAFLHGFAHGSELPPAASALAYGAGFVVATLALHAIGLALGALPRAKVMPRIAGAGIAAAGLVLLVLV